MAFDKRSFLAGVLMGLKLQRPPEGRTPPVTSGEVILAEDGTPMITEHIQWSNVSIYKLGSWYPSTYIQYGQDYYQRFGDEAAPETWYFFATVTDDTFGGSHNIIIFLSAQDYVGNSDVQLKHTQEGTPQSIYQLSVLGLYSPGEIRSSYTLNVETRLIIPGSILFVGTGPELMDFIASGSIKTLITD